MQFSGILSTQTPDHLRLRASIKLNGLTPEQQEIQRYQDCYHGRLFKPKEERHEKRQYAWGTKWDGQNNAIPESKWKPNYIISLPKKIVSAHSAYLFSEESFPNIKITSRDPGIYSQLELDPKIAEPEAARKAAANAKLQTLLEALIEQADLETAMQNGSEDGIVQGSVYILASVWDGEIGLEVLDRKWSKLEMDPVKPKRALRFVEEYILQEEDAWGQAKDYLYRREIDATTWREWRKLLSDKEQVPKLTDADLLFEPFVHALDFVPVFELFMPNRRSLFADEIVDNIRGLIRQDNQIKVSITRNLDPQPYVLKRPGGEGYSAEDLDEDDDGEPDAILEPGVIWPIHGDSVGTFSTSGSHEIAVKDKDAMIREIEETCHVVSIPEDNQQSGKALNTRLKPTRAFISRLRTSMGRKGLAKGCLMLIDIAMRMAELGKPLSLPAEVELPKRLANNEFRIGLDWGEIIPPDEDDKQKIIFNADAAKKAGFIAKRTAAAAVAPYYGVEDVEAELELIEEERAADQAQIMQAQAAAFQQMKPPGGFARGKQSDV